MTNEKYLEEILTMNLVENNLDPKIEPGLTWNQAVAISKYIVKVVVEARKILNGEDEHVIQ